MPGWKIAQSKQQTAKKTKLALIVLALVIALLFVAQAVKFTQTLFSPWSSSANVRTYRWNGDFTLNVLAKLDSISLISYSPRSEKVTIINIPNETYLEVPAGYGKWQVGSIYGLGGGKLLEDSLSSFFGLPIDGFLDFSGQYSDIFGKDPFSFFKVLPNLKTDLTLMELLKFKMGLASVRFDKIDEIDLKDLGLLTKAKLADGTEVLEADVSQLDSLSSYMVDPIISSEHKSIAIFNATDHPFLAQKAARVITNIGGDVIIVSNSQTKYKITQIAGEKSKTLDRLKQIFEGSDNIDPTNGDLVSSRAQINLFLGEDYFNK